MSFLQCPKRLFLEIHHSELAEVDEQTEAAFSTGHQVGAAARQVFGNGPRIAPDNNLHEALAATHDLLSKPDNSPLYEATFQHEGVLVRADVLLRHQDKLDLVEVKASTQVKDVHIPDCAIQNWVIEGAGYPLRSVSVAHINSQFVYETEGNYQGLLVVVPVTQQVKEMGPQVRDWARKGVATLSGSVPEISVGPHCHTPYDCPFTNYCEPDHAEFPVSILGSRAKLVRQLIKEGVRDVDQVPFDRLQTDEQIRRWRATVEGKPAIDLSVAKLLQALPYPRYYFDFETIGPPVPIWLGTRPYQSLPFQWSCHIERAQGQMEHVGFLASGDGPPMRETAECLLEALEKHGPILVYTTYEKGCLETLGGLYPDLKPGLDAVIERLYNLHPVLKTHYYHREMKGSWSIKAVLPTIVPELDYKTVGEVQHGRAASAAFAEIIDPQTSLGRRQALRTALEDYCRLDTLAMLRIVQVLAGM